MKLEFRTAGRMDHYFCVKKYQHYLQAISEIHKRRTSGFFMLISLTNIAKYRRQANHIDESKFGDTEGLLAFGDDCKIFRGSN